MKRTWELKQAATPDTLEMYIYGDVKSDYFDWWTWDMVESETSANHFRNELAKYPDVKEIKIFINSYGGSVFEGTAIYSQLRRHPAQKTVYIDGFACSVASVIAMAGDRVIMPKNTMMMIHNAWNIVAGNATQLRKAADDLDTIMAGNRQSYLQKSNGKITEEKLIELLDAETWLTAEQCIEYGFADELLEKDADLTEAKQLLQKMNKTLEQQLSYNRAIAVQFRELAKEPIQKTPPSEPPPEPPKENKTIKFMAALFR
ncbi:peptidase S14, ClpP [Desulforamulus reducens MI-1]|uniref:ATP-dependent Clp protease proteolytic subunit n=1 Tax=Desulforamulus reducens (strain ATCC BAA-1160 / DSM 100696 / MI-1) TaxID=349161 RepID=A4J7R2_DESRM|nr:head maturation protease, ClpP-related [Desulforamulus reducens]ABO51115.1 peptidase S14, ClpP [Desulforamulus reducens MI-1]